MTAQASITAKSLVPNVRVQPLDAGLMAHLPQDQRHPEPARRRGRWYLAAPGLGAST
jgi:hypothetical protein